MKIKQDDSFFIVTGADLYERKEQVDGLVDAIVKMHGETDAITRISINELSPEIIASMRVSSLFTPIQIFIITRLEKIKKKESDMLLGYLVSPHDATWIIVEGDELPRDRAVTAAVTPLKKYAHEVIIKKKNSAYARGLDAIVYSYLTRHGYSITPDAQELLLARVGGSASFLTRMLNSIAGRLTSGQTIDEDAVLSLTQTYAEYDSYALMNALCDRKLDKGLEVLAFLIEEGTKEYELLPFMGMQFRRLFDAKKILERGGNASKVLSQLNVRFFKDQFLAQVRQFTKNELIKILDELATIDIHLKTSAADTRTEMETLFCRLCTRQLV